MTNQPNDTNQSIDKNNSSSLPSQISQSSSPIETSSSPHVSSTNTKPISSSCLFNLSSDTEEMAIEGDDEMDEDEENVINPSNCSCNHSQDSVGIIPNNSSLHSYNKSIKAIQERRQEIRRQENVKKKFSGIIG